MASSNFPNRPFRLQDTVWLLSQNVAGNYSTVRAQLAINKNSYSPTFSSATSNYTFWINGQQVAGNNFTYDFRNSDSLLIANVDVNIPHNADGTKPSIAIDAYANVAVMGYTELHSSIPLPTIPRASTATFSPSNTFDAGTAVTINTNRASSGFTHDINYYFGTLGPVTITNDVTTSTTWTPPLSMLNQIPTSTVGNGIIRTNTKTSPTVMIGQTDTQFFLKVPASIVPTVTTPTAVEQNSTVSSVVGALVQGLSVVKVAATSAGVYSSTIKSTTLKVGGITVANNANVLLDTSGTIAVRADVTDSRGRTANATRNLTVLPYSDPTVTAFSAKRTNSSGVAQADGTYMRFDLAAVVSSLVNGTQRNAMKITVRTRPSEGAWTTRNVINTGLSYSSGGLITGGSVYPVSTSFEVEVTVEDNLGRSFVALTTVATSAVTMDLNGRNVGIGKFHEEGALDVGGEIFQNGSRVISLATADTDMPNRLDRWLTDHREDFADWNDVVATGWYNGNNKLNSPGAGFWMGDVVAHNSTYVIQTLTAFTQAGLNSANVFRRRMVAGAWGPWERMYSSATEIEGLNATPWTNLTLASGWGSYAGETATYRVKGGACFLSGRITGTTAAGTTIATLPTNARHTAPSAMVFNTHSDNGSTVMLVGSNGSVVIATRAGLDRTGVSLAGISFPVG